MTPTIRAHPVEDPSMARRVRHYDELAEDAKERLPTLLEGGDPVVPAETAADFQHGEVVKFTRYYRIEIVDVPSSTGVRADSSS